MFYLIELPDGNEINLLCSPNYGNESESMDEQTKQELEYYHCSRLTVILKNPNEEYDPNFIDAQYECDNQPMINFMNTYVDFTIIENKENELFVLTDPVFDGIGTVELFDLITELDRVAKKTRNQFLINTNRAEILNHGQISYQNVWLYDSMMRTSKTLYSLMEFKGMENLEINLLQNYLSGRFGGL